jgi:hypothetical protein
MGESAMIGRTYYDRSRLGWYLKALVAVFDVVTDGAPPDGKLPGKGLQIIIIRIIIM